MLRRSPGLSNGSFVGSVYGSGIENGTGTRTRTGTGVSDWGDECIDSSDARSWLITWPNSSACVCAGQKLIRQSEIESCSCKTVKCLSWPPLCHVDVSCFGSWFQLLHRSFVLCEWVCVAWLSPIARSNLTFKLFCYASCRGPSN